MVLPLRALSSNAPVRPLLSTTRPVLPLAQTGRNGGDRRLAPVASVRYSSHSPLGSAPVNPRKKVTMQTIRKLYKKGEPIAMLTAHDFPSGHVADAAGVEMVLVGDSLAMVALGMEDTSELLMDEMLLHCRSVARAAKSSFTVCLSGLRYCGWLGAEADFELF